MSNGTARMGQVITAGSSGGEVLWGLSLMHGGLPVAEHAPFPGEQWRWISLLLSAFLGAAAAFVSVYWLANTDTTKKTQCLGFAVICGLMWEPVLTGAGQRFTTGFADLEATEAVRQANQLTGAVNTGPALQPQAAADVAVKLVEAGPNIQNPGLKVDAKHQTERILNALATQALTQPAATEALVNIGVAPGEAGPRKKTPLAG